MICPSCKLSAFIGKARYVIEDNKLYYEQDMVCRNKKCAKNGKTIEVVRSELPLQTRSDEPEGTSKSEVEDTPTEE